MLPTFTREGSQVRSLSRPPIEISAENQNSQAVWGAQAALDCVVYLS